MSFWRIRPELWTLCLEAYTAGGEKEDCEMMIEVPGDGWVDTKSIIAVSMPFPNRDKWHVRVDYIGSSQVFLGVFDDREDALAFAK